MCASHRAVRGLIVELTGYCKHTITDMEAGLEHLKRGTAKNVDMMIIVVEPYYRSLEAGMRTFKLAKELNIKHLYVASNKFTNEADENAIKEFCEKYTMPIISNIPYDSNLIEAERNEKAPYDYNIEAPSIKAINKIADAGVKIIEKESIWNENPVDAWMVFWASACARRQQHLIETDTFEKIDPLLRLFIEMGTTMDGASYATAIDTCHKLGYQLQEFFNE